jgi:hypothetical protein
MQRNSSSNETSWESVATRRMASARSRLDTSPIAKSATGCLFVYSHSQENVMKRKHEQKNDFFYSFVIFAMFAVVVFNVAAEFIDRHPEAFFVDTNEALEPREISANADACDFSVASGRRPPWHFGQADAPVCGFHLAGVGRRVAHLPR